MGRSQIILFIVLATLVLGIFISGILLFVVQYRRRRILHEGEKEAMTQTHQRELLATQVQIQEQTMQDIGREIHDNIGQRLTLASIYANQLLAQDAGKDERLASVGTIINESLSDLRALSKSLVSTEADADELRTLLHRECDRIAALRICAVNCRLDGSRFTIPATVKNFLLRIVQEAFQNSLKHSGCAEISLALDYDDGGLDLSVTDDGRGFQPDSPAAGIGLQNMKKRATLIDATLDVRSSSDGTRIALHVPHRRIHTS